MKQDKEFIWSNHLKVPPMPTFIFRIFDANNLRSILEDGCFHCPRAIQEINKQIIHISHIEIMERRAKVRVPCGPKGILTDYVAFYFAPRSPMLYSIHKGNIGGHVGDQQQIIYAVSTAQVVAAANRRFVFSDGHGIMNVTDFFDDLSDLDKIDWKIMYSDFWNDTDDQPDRKRRRQAEFLVHRAFPWDLVHEIAVMTNNMKISVQRILATFNVKTSVRIRRDWYY